MYELEDMLGEIVSQKEVEGMLREDFAGRVLPVDSSTDQVYAVIAAARRAAGIR